MDTPEGMKEIPRGDFCWVCGNAIECWPLLTSEDIMSRLSCSKAFRAEWQLVVAGVERSDFNTVRREEVSSQRMCGIKIYFQAAFVESSIFVIYFKVPHASMSCVKQVKVWGPENDWMTGVLLRLPLPDDLPHFLCQVFATTQRALDTIVLPADKVYRENQAAERFNLACSNMMKDRSDNLAELRTTKWPTMCSFQEATAEAHRIAEDRKRAEAQLDMRCNDESWEPEHACKPVGRSSLEDEAMAPPTTVAKKGRKSTPGKKASGDLPTPSKKKKIHGESVSTICLTSPQASVVGGGGGTSVCGLSIPGSSASTVMSVEPEEDVGAENEKQTWDITAIMNGWNCGRELKKVLAKKNVMSYM